MALLNSNLFWWYLVNTGTILANNYFRFKPNYIFPFPVPIINKNVDFELQRIVDEILIRKQNDRFGTTLDLEMQIDNLIYQLYNLSEQDISQIKLLKHSL